MQRSIVLPSLSMTKNLQQLFSEYISECQFARRSRPATIRGYQQTFITFCTIMPGIALQDLTSTTLTRFFKILEERKRIVGKGTVKVGVKKSTIATYWCKLNNFFTWLQRRNYLKENPFSGMTYPLPVYEDRKFLRRIQVEKILAAIHSHFNGNLLILKRNLVIFYLLMFCGLRREELLLLQIRDIDLERKIVTVRAETSKIPRTRYLPMHTQLASYLKDYLAARLGLTTPFLIVSSQRDDRLSYDGLKHLVTNLNNYSGVRFHLHQFRHTFAVNFLKNSNNIAKLKQLMGHKDIRMTLTYLRCLPTNEMRGDIESMNIDTLV